MVQSGGRDYPLDFFLQPMKPAKPGKTKSAKQKLKKAMTSEQYIAEEKIDGCHYFSIGGRIFSTRVSVKDGIPVEKTEQAKHLAQILRQGGEKLILDGEIYLPGGKSQDVVSIMGSDPDVALAKQQEGSFVQYKVFDILRDPDGRWVTDQPWSERRKLLQACIGYFNFDPAFVQISPIVEENKERFLEEILSRGGEGIVLKHVNKPYICGKRPAWNWIKCKVETEDDVVIMGYEPPERIYTGKQIDSWKYWALATSEPFILNVDSERLLCNGDKEIMIRGNRPSSQWEPVTRYYAMKWIGAIVFGKYDKTGNLIRLGTCSGMTDAERKEFSENGDKYIGRVAKVKLMELTRDGAYRHCSFVSLHEDKAAHECVLEE